MNDVVNSDTAATAIAMLDQGELSDVGDPATEEIGASGQITQVTLVVLNRRRLAILTGYIHHRRPDLAKGGA